MWQQQISVKTIILVLVSLVVVFFLASLRKQSSSNDNVIHTSSDKQQVHKSTVLESLNNCPKPPPCPACPKDINTPGPAPAPAEGVPAVDGQVTASTTFGKALYQLARQDDVRTVLEIGTWYGGGTTQNLARGLQETGSDKVLYTIEMYEPAWQHARTKYSNMPIRFILGGTVPPEGYLRPEEIPDKDEHYRLYYQRDIELAKKTIPWLKPLCLGMEFDAVLIDGNEYTGWAEYEVVDKHCKPKYLALHDVGTLKTNKIEKVIKKGGTVWELYKEGQDAARWQIYKRKE